MLSLTTPISIPNLQKVRVDAVQLDGNLNIGTITCSVLGSGNIVYSVVTLSVRDGSSQGLRATVSPLGFNDRVELFAVDTPTGFTQLVAADTGSNITVRNKAVESALLAAGLLPPGTVT